MPVLQQIHRQIDPRRQSLAAGIAGMGDAIGSGLQRYGMMQADEQRFQQQRQDEQTRQDQQREDELEQIAKEDAQRLLAALPSIPQGQRKAFLDAFTPVLGERGMKYINAEAAQGLPYQDANEGILSDVDNSQLSMLENNIKQTQKELSEWRLKYSQVNPEAAVGGKPKEERSFWFDKTYSDEEKAAAQHIMDLTSRLADLQNQYQSFVQGKRQQPWSDTAASLAEPAASPAPSMAQAVTETAPAPAPQPNPQVQNSVLSPVEGLLNDQTVPPQVKKIVQMGRKNGYSDDEIMKLIQQYIPEYYQQKFPQ